MLPVSMKLCGMILLSIGDFYSFHLYFVLCPSSRYGPRNNSNWLLFAHDIYGPDSVRTKQYCEKMATDLGVTCIIPDFFRGLVRPDPRPNWEDKYSEYKNQSYMAQYFPLIRK